MLYWSIPKNTKTQIFVSIRRKFACFLTLSLTLTQAPDGLGHGAGGARQGDEGGGGSPPSSSPSSLSPVVERRLVGRRRRRRRRRHSR